MKYGRTTKITSPPVKGPGDGTKQEVSVAPKKKLYSEEELIKNMDERSASRDAEAAYKKELDDYNNSMESYKRQLDFYNKGPEPEKEDAGSVKIDKGGKTVKGQQVTFEQGERYSAAKSNADLDRALKENKNIVNIYDKSINPASRKIYLEQYGDDSTSDLYGRTTGGKFVDRDIINKIKSPRDIWGEDFDAVEWSKAANDKNPDAFDKYLTKKGYHGRTFAAKEGMGYYNRYVTPTEPEKPVRKPIPPPPAKINPKDVSFNPIKLQKPTLIKQGKQKYSKFIPDKEIEEGDWNDPTGGKFKRKGAILKSGTVEAKGPKGAGGGRSASVNLSIFSKRIKTENSRGGYGIQRGPGSGESKGLRAREENMAKAFYAPESEWGRGGYYSSMEGTEGNVSKAIRSEIKDIRSEKKDWKKQTSLTGAAKRAGAREVFKEDIKTGRQAARYARRGDLKSLDTNPLTDESGGVWKAGQKSKLKIYTPEITKYGDEGAMSGYVAAAEKNIEAAKKYQQNEMTAKSNQLRADFNKQSWKNYGEEGFIQKAEDNATNRNTVIAQMEKYKGWGSKIK